MRALPQSVLFGRWLLVVFCCLALNASVQAAGILVPSGQSADLSAQSLRITDHLVSAEIRNGIGLTTINQTFENMTDQRLEGTYIFPIPEGADITNFQMTFNGKMVEGEVLPADEARQIYENIVRKQRDPGLIEFIGRRLLRARVFPIEPRAKTEIQISYQQVIDQVSGMSRYRYPLRTPGTNGHAYGTVRFSVSLESQAPLKAVWSPSHSVEVVRDGDNRAKVAYEKVGVSLDEDFLLLYDTDDQDVGMSLVAHQPEGEDEGHFLMILSPKDLWDEDLSIPQDYVFVVDTSGSMAGEKIDQAKASLEYCVQRLEAKDRFSVVRFSTGFDLVFDELRNGDADAKTAALKAIKKFKATGGTNIYNALSAAVKLRDEKSAGRPFVVIFLTDGLGDRSREEIEKMLGEETASIDADLRIYPFGVGHDVNTKLLDSLAVNFGGMPTYVAAGENLEHRLGDFFSVFSEPVLTDVKVRLPEGGEISDRFPPAPGDLYHGRQLILAGQFGQETTGRVVLTGRRGDERVRYEWGDVELKSTEDADYVSRIWAGRKLAFLLDQIRLQGESDEMVDEVVRLATRWGIQTPYTSWLVAPEGRGGFSDDRDIRLGLRQSRRAPGNAMPQMRGRALGSGGGPSESGGGRRGKSAGAAPSRSVQDAVEQLGEEADLELMALMRGGADKPTDELGRIDLDDESGESAVYFAKVLGSMRDGDAVDASVSNSAGLVMRHFGGRDYWNLSGALVDAAFAEDTETIDVMFGSDAYFDIVMNRKDLRKVFAEAKFVIVMVGEKLAVFVHPTTGLETLTDELKERVFVK